MKGKLIWLIALCFAFASCSKDLQHSPKLTESTEISDPIIEFTEILSKAVTSEPDLRAFIKEEALERFDLDYDVFYPWAKNKKISSGMTFRDMLLAYDEKGILSTIEQALPYLNIYVPDWSWIDDECFSIHNWDTNDPDIAVGYEDNSDFHQLYINGRVGGVINNGDIPAFPIILVKNNERMLMTSPQTKGSDPTYDFAHSVYNPQNRVETKKTYTQYWDYDSTGTSNFAAKDQLNDLVIDAYDEFGKGWNNAMHRDYIYYGMNKANTTNGKLNPNIVETIFRFRVATAAASSISDNVDGDPSFNGSIERWKDANAFEGNEIQPFLWTEGAYEIEFIFNWGNGTSTSVKELPKVFTVEPHELWELTKSSVKKNWRPFDGFKNRYIYTNATVDLVKKWYYPDTPVELPLWDISTLSTELWFGVYEHDDPSEITTTFTNTYKYTNNFKASVDVEAGRDTSLVKGSLGLEYSNSNESTTTVTTQYKMTHESNDMGHSTYNFSSPIITSDLYEYNGIQGYDLKSVSTGTVEVTFVPKRL